MCSVHSTILCMMLSKVILHNQASMSMLIHWCCIPIRCQLTTGVECQATNSNRPVDHTRDTRSRIVGAVLCASPVVHGSSLYLSRAGPGGEEVPPVFVDRGGVKVALQETYSRNSKGSLGLVLERVCDLTTSPQFPASFEVDGSTIFVIIPQLTRELPT